MKKPSIKRATFFGSFTFFSLVFFLTYKDIQELSLSGSVLDLVLFSINSRLYLIFLAFVACYGGVFLAYYIHRYFFNRNN